MSRGLSVYAELVGKGGPTFPALENRWMTVKFQKGINYKIQDKPSQTQSCTSPVTASWGAGRLRARGQP